MRYFALATDYDGTLAHDGAVSPATIAALERLRSFGASVNGVVLSQVCEKEYRRLNVVSARVHPDKTQRTRPTRKVAPLFRKQIWKTLTVLQARPPREKPSAAKS